MNESDMERDYNTVSVPVMTATIDDQGKPNDWELSYVPTTEFVPFLERLTPKDRKKLKRNMKKLRCKWKLHRKIYVMRMKWRKLWKK